MSEQPSALRRGLVSRLLHLASSAEELDACGEPWDEHTTMGQLISGGGLSYAQVCEDALLARWPLPPSNLRGRPAAH